MSKQNVNNSELDNLLAQAFTLREVNSESLSPRLEEVRRRHRVAHSRQQGRRLLVRRASILASAASIVLLLATILPRMLVWRAIAQIAEAEEQARSMHLITWAIEPDSSRRKSTEMWIQGNQERTERPEAVLISTADKIYDYQPRTKVAHWRPKTEADYSRKRSGFSIRAMMADMSRWGTGDKMTLSPDEEVVDNRPARVATLEPARENIRQMIYADPETLLPFRVDLLRPTGDDWKIVQTTELEYNISLPATLFEAKFPERTRVTEAGAERQEWLASLNKTVAVAYTKEREERLTIRDVQMNDEGDIFMLYTGHTASQVDWYSLDNSLLPLQTEFADDFAVGSADGEPLHSMVFTRLEPLTPAQSRQPQQVPVAAGRTAVYYVELKGVISKTPTIEPYMGQAINLPIPRATLNLLPDYVQYSYRVIRESEFKNAVDTARAKRWEEIAAGDPARLEKALELRRAIVKRSEQWWRESGNQGVQPDAWLTVAKLCRKLGRQDEMLDALAHAEDDDRIYGNARREIEEFKKQMAHG